MSLTVFFTTSWAVGLQVELWIMDTTRVCYTGPKTQNMPTSLFTSLCLLTFANVKIYFFFILSLFHSQANGKHCFAKSVLWCDLCN